MLKANLVIRGKNCLEVNRDSLDSETYEFIDEAVKTLEQEPTDAVSRDAIRLKIANMPKYANGTKIRSTRKLKEFLEKEYPEDTFEVTPDMSIGFTLALDFITEFIQDLPPVTPTHKKCKWILYDYQTIAPKEHENISNPYWRIPTRYKTELKYCPYCGGEIDYSEIDTEIEKRGGEE